MIGSRRKLSAGMSLGLWLLSSGLLLVAALWHESLLPARFMLDKTELLRRMEKDQSPTMFGDSFDNYAWLYNAAGLDAWSLSVVGWFAAISACFLAIRASQIRELKVLEWMVLSFWMAISIVYAGLPSKEIVVLVMVALALCCRPGMPRVAMLAILAAIFALYFRGYWVLIISGWLALYMLGEKALRPIRLVVLILLAYALLSVLFEKHLGGGLTLGREVGNEWRSATEVASLIESPLPQRGFVFDIVNVVIILATFVVPVPLLTSGNPVQAAGGVGLFLTFCLLATSWRRILRMPSRCSAEHRQMLSFVISFLCVQAIFEPDYGSFLRHLTSISPLILYCCLASRREEGSWEMNPGPAEFRPIHPRY
ncbi:hypothetical protein [Cupriavidus oxalaticus]|uniref:Uncharacterized protein n=1 Tax=Cupriavidus oxalaticus TaxID=96344 RepID=A0A4P7LIU3_9BURK|nr:hypothetical protein [Cupriavidus oxalaticus]QBY55508.1 hypothetical protein E0W60_31305 [Cupriavidus oxalaticus]